MDPGQRHFHSQRSPPPPPCPDRALVYLCVLCDGLLDSPMQSSCGDRMCKGCLEILDQSLRQRGAPSARCPGCGEQLIPVQCFPDRAASRELSVLVVTCPNDCLWEGQYQDYPAHYTVCPRRPTRCPHPSCSVTLPLEELEHHKTTCPYKPVKCRYCYQELQVDEVKVHERVCPAQPVQCQYCREPVPSNEMEVHVAEECLQVERKCPFAQFGCNFNGPGDKVSEHEKENFSRHMRMVSRAVVNNSQQVTQAISVHEQRSHPQYKDRHIETAIDHMEGRITELTRQVGDLMTDTQRMKAEAHARAVAVEDMFSKHQRSIKELQEYYSDVAMSIQTIQASSHGPVFIWKIPDLSRRRKDARNGKTVSLYSAPFYTSRHGYKICLRVYLNGDGGGRGTHLSFFMTMMKGDFDSLLPWPFKQTTTLTLLAQDRAARDISQSFKPDEVSGSFIRPTSEMNVASGCPLFCPLSVLDSPAYVQNDNLYLKCVVNTKGIEHIT